MKCPLGTSISHTQLASYGYPAGYPGDENAPDKVFMNTPHLAVNQKPQNT